MDSTEYFARAERANKRYRKVMVILCLCVTITLTVMMLVLFKINQTNHDNSVKTQQTIIDNEIKLNENLANSLHCIFDYPPGTRTIAETNVCFDSKNNLSDPKGN